MEMIGTKLSIIFAVICNLFHLLSGQGSGVPSLPCTTPCMAGQTCYYVRHGNGPPELGCISMQEAILLHQAQQGGASGPGTGIPAQGAMGMPGQPGSMQMQPFEAVPDMGALGIGRGTSLGQPQSPGFEGGFQQGLGGMGGPAGAGMGGMSGMGGFPGAGMGAMGGLAGAGMAGMGAGMAGMGGLAGAGIGGMGTGMGARMGAGMGEMGGLAGAGMTGMGGMPGAGMGGMPGAGMGGMPGTGMGGMPGAGMGGMPGAGMGGMPGAGMGGMPGAGMGGMPGAGMGGMSGAGMGGMPGMTGMPSGFGAGAQGGFGPASNVLDPITGRPVSLRQGGMGDGGRLSNVAHGRGGQSVGSMRGGGALGQQSFPGEASLLGGSSLPNARIANPPGLATAGAQTSNILEDEFGFFYMFYPRAESIGARVNITKEGYCRRDAQIVDQNLCMNTCYSDSQCPREMKCCPSGCSLGCLRPNMPASTRL